jgi:segregation and condensation protein B
VTMDRELEDLPQDLRWREWIRRIEAVLFASATPVSREALARAVGQGVSVDLLVEDLAAELEGRAFEVARVDGGWLLRTRAGYGEAVRAAADLGDQVVDLNWMELGVLAAVALHQPISRDGLRDLFDKDISRDVIGRLATQGLIGRGPRSPKRGSAFTYVTTERFLTVFGLESLRDLDAEALADAGFVRSQDKR